jgi:molybdenum cofactor cytidylyltransferase
MSSPGEKVERGKGGESGSNLIPIIVLAAGSSSRLGESKQLLIIDGKPLLQKIVAEAMESHIGPIVVVLGFESERHRTIIADLPVDVVINKNWQNGMGSSIKTGLHFVEEKFVTAKGVLISVCDQPQLTSHSFRALADKFNSHPCPLVASRYANTFGVPALFNRTLFPEIHSLKDNEGAKKIILSHSRDASYIDFPGGAIDLDTPDEVLNYKMTKKL